MPYSRYDNRRDSRRPEPLSNVSPFSFVSSFFIKFIVYFFNLYLVYFFLHCSFIHFFILVCFLVHSFIFSLLGMFLGSFIHSFLRLFLCPMYVHFISLLCMFLGSFLHSFFFVCCFVHFFIHLLSFNFKNVSSLNPFRLLFCLYFFIRLSFVSSSNEFPTSFFIHLTICFLGEPMGERVSAGFLPTVRPNRSAFSGRKPVGPNPGKVHQRWGWS